MKRFVMVALLMAFLVCTGGAQQRYGIQGVASGEFVVRYMNPDSVMFQMVLDSADGRIRLQIPLSSYVRGDRELAFMKTEVERLVSANAAVGLGNSGYIFRFIGEYPVWGPYSTLGPSGDFKCLFFAEGGWVSNGTINARGSRAKPIGFYPYSLQ